MTLPSKYITLLLGLVLVSTSFLFFGRQQDTYLILNIGGLATALIAYLTILFGKGHIKIKSFWTAIVILSVIVQQFAEPIIIDSSYLIYIRQNKSTLIEINNILLQKSGDITVSADTVITKNDSLTTDETSRLRTDREKLGVYHIAKYDKGVYYGLWGFLDVRLGIAFLPGKRKSDNQYRHLTGNWFR